MVDEDEDKANDREGWETILMDGQTVGIRTSAIEEKCQAFETLVIYCSTLGPRFAPYLSQALELTLPSLRFYFHDGVREACAMCVLCFHPVSTDEPHVVLYGQAHPYAVVLWEKQ